MKQGVWYFDTELQPPDSLNIKMNAGTKNYFIQYVHDVTITFYKVLVQNMEQQTLEHARML
jgi:hypothetical protein